MRGAAENLDGKGWLDATRALFQIPDVLFLRFANAAERRAEANAHSILRIFARTIDMRVFQCELCRHHCELRVTIQPFQAVRRKVFFGVPIANLARASHVEHARIEACDGIDAAFLCEDPLPKPMN